MTTILRGFTRLSPGCCRLTVERHQAMEQHTFRLSEEEKFTLIQWDEPIELYWDFAPLRKLNEVARSIAQGEEVPLPLTLG